MLWVKSFGFVCYLLFLWVILNETNGKIFKDRQKSIEQLRHLIYFFDIYLDIMVKGFLNTPYSMILLN